MIEIVAKLIQGSIYLAGDTLECHVIFTNSSPTDGPGRRNEVLAWASVQINCWVSGVEQLVNLDAVNPASTFPGMERSSSAGSLAKGSSSTSFMPAKADQGRVVFATTPQILFCDLTLGPGESKTFIYKETLPKGIPPSYKGHAVRYWYKVGIGTQKVGSSIRSMQIPLKVLVIHGFPGLMNAGGIPQPISDPRRGKVGSDTVSPANPFLLSSSRESGGDVAMEFLQSVTSRKSATAYNVTHALGKVGTFYLYKTGYRLGEDIVGTFNLKDSKVRCVKFLVTLQSEETIAQEYRKRPDQSSTVLPFNKYHQYCLNLEETQVILPIPLHVTPTFQTELVCLKWRLHFEFVTTTTKIAEFVEPEDITEPVIWTGPPALEIETMVWDLPIKIFPASPVTVAQGLQLESEIFRKF